MATLTFRALHGTTPPYMTSQFTRVADMPNHRRLRSASSNQLDVPSFCLPTLGSRAFPIAGAKVWNSLPDDVTSVPSLSSFWRHLKTYRYLIRCCYRLRSASSNQLDVPSFCLPTVGSCVFPIARAKVWNSLPDNVTSAPSLSTFRRHLKTYLFRCCYNTVRYCCTYSDYSGPHGGVAA